MATDILAVASERERATALSRASRPVKDPRQERAATDFVAHVDHLQLQVPAVAGKFDSTFRERVGMSTSTNTADGDLAVSS